MRHAGFYKAVAGGKKKSVFRGDRGKAFNYVHFCIPRRYTSISHFKKYHRFLRPEGKKFSFVQDDCRERRYRVMKEEG